MNLLQISKNMDEFKQEYIIKNLNEIISEINNFNIREMYIVDSNYCFDISSLVIKDNCVLLKFDYIRAIVFTDKAYLINYKCNDFVLKLNANTNSNFNSNKYFHLTIIDYLFTEISNFFLHEITELTPEISSNNESIKNVNIHIIKLLLFNLL